MRRWWEVWFGTGVSWMGRLEWKGLVRGNGLDSEQVREQCGKGASGLPRLECRGGVPSRWTLQNEAKRKGLTYPGDG